MESEVITLHKNDLKTGENKLKTLTPNSNEWWQVKEKLKMYHIAYSQALNNAVDWCRHDFGEPEIKEWHMYFYKLLTAPYRVHKDQFRDGSKKAKEDKTITNIDHEIELPQTND